MLGQLLHTILNALPLNVIPGTGEELPIEGFLLLEDSSYLLLEDNSLIELE